MKFCCSTYSIAERRELVSCAVGVQDVSSSRFVFQEGEVGG